MVIQVLYSGAGRGGVSGFVSPETQYYSSYILSLRLGYGLHDPGFKLRQGHFSLLQKRPDWLWGDPASYSMNIGILFRR